MMPRQLMVMVKKEFLQILRDRRLLPIILIAPLVQLLIYGYAATTDIKQIATAVLDHDRGVKARELRRVLENAGYFKISSYPSHRQQMFHELDSGRVLVAIEIPSGFSRDIQRRRPTYIQAFIDGSDSNASAIILGYLNNIAESLSTRLLTQAIGNLTFTAGQGLPPPVPLPTNLLIDIRPRVWYNPDLRSVNYMVPGVIGMILLTLMSNLTSLSFVKEKERGTLEQLMVTPLAGHWLLLGKMVPFALIGLANVFLIIAAGWWWFGVRIQGSFILLVLLSSFFILSSLGEGIFISTITRTQQQANIASTFFAIPNIILSGFIFPIASMPPLVQYCTYLVPFRYFLEILRGIYLKGVGFDLLWDRALILAGFGVIFLAIGMLRMRRILRRL